MGGRAEPRRDVSAGDECNMRSICPQRRGIHQRQDDGRSVLLLFRRGPYVGLVYWSGHRSAGTGCCNILRFGSRRGGETWGVREIIVRAIFCALCCSCCCLFVVVTAVCRHLASHLCKTLYEEECVVTLFTSCSRDYSSYLKWGDG